MQQATAQAETENAIASAMTKEEYDAENARSIGEEATEYWLEQSCKHLTWFKEPTVGLQGDFHDMRQGFTWFADGSLNAAYNCVDRHLKNRGDQTALVWESNEPQMKPRHISYAELSGKVNRFANVLLSRGVEKGDRVAIYMPMIPEAVFAMLACARIGAVHSVVFSAFSPEALQARINQAGCKVVITTDAGFRGSKSDALKEKVDKALESCPGVKTVIVVQHAGRYVSWYEGRDVWYHQAMAQVSEVCPAAEMNAEDPLFILYTSGSTGEPKGVLHTTGGYLLGATKTFKEVFDYREGDVYCCTADIGWITGHSYIVYGPLAAGATVVLFEGIPTYPDASRFWQMVDKHNISIFYTAPTAIRMLKRLGDEYVLKTKRSSLRILGTVGEPINPEAFAWYRDTVGNGQCPIVDTWWQTETGAHMLTTIPGTEEAVPSVAGRPYFGVCLELVDDKGNVIEGEGSGNLVLTRPVPWLSRGIYGDKDNQRLIDTYYSVYPGRYFTGDGASRDVDGRIKVTGRVDDVLNVSGHRLGTAELESALALHEKVAEAAVVGYPHDIKGEGVYAYVTLKMGEVGSDTLRKELVARVRQEIGPIATIDVLQWAPDLPKTRSGKIMRRILRKLACGDINNLGDTSTLADPSVVEKLCEVVSRA